MGQPDYAVVVCTVCGVSLTGVSVAGGGETASAWIHPRDGRARDHEPAPGMWSPGGPRPGWTCDFCGARPPSCWWQPGTIDLALPQAFIAPGVTDGSAGGPWMACPDCGPLVAAGDLPGLVRRWRDLSPAPPRRRNWPGRRLVPPAARLPLP